MDEIRQCGTCRAPGNTRTRTGMGTALSIKERLLSKVIILAVHIHRYAGLPDCLSVPRSAGGTPAIRSHEYTKQMFGKGRRAGGEGGGAQRGYAACLSQGRRHLARSLGNPTSSLLMQPTDRDTAAFRLQDMGPAKCKRPLWHSYRECQMRRGQMI